MLFTHAYGNTGKNSKNYILKQSNFKRIGLSAIMLLICSVTSIFTARMLGAKAFGIYMFLHWLVTFALPVIGIGMSTLTSRRLVNLQVHETTSSRAGIFYLLWYRQCQSILLYCVFYLLLIWPLYQTFSIATPLRLFLSCLAALPLFLSGIVDITLRSMRRLDLLALLHLSGASITLILMIGISQMASAHLEVFLIAFALANTLTLILAMTCIARFLPLKQAQTPHFFLKARLQHCFKNPLLDFAIDAIIWQPSELFLLALWRDPADLGLYALSVLISNGFMHLTPMLMSNWILPFFLRHRPDSHYSSAYDAFAKTSCSMALLAIPIYVLVTTLSPLLINLILGPDYLAMVQPLCILLVGSVFGSVATVSLTRLAASGHTKIRQHLGISAAVVNIVLALPCIAFWGITGAAAASAVAQIFSATGLFLLCRKALLQEAFPVKRGVAMMR